MLYTLNYTMLYVHYIFINLGQRETMRLGDRQPWFTVQLCSLLCYHKQITSLSVIYFIYEMRIKILPNFQVCSLIK